MVQLYRAVNGRDLTALERAGEVILQCTHLVPDVELEMEEHIAQDDADNAATPRAALER